MKSPNVKRWLLSVTVLTIAAGTWTAVVRAASRPKLVVAIVVDQFRYDYLERFRSEYTGGFDRFLNKGAVFTNAGYIHAKTVTAIGHATYLTGATPSVSGIVGNEWYDRTLRRTVQSVSDTAVRTIGRPPAAAAGASGSTARAGAAGASGASGASGRLPTLAASPRALLVSTVGDELKMRYPGSRVIGVSIKDRAAIMPSGHMADGAYWFANDVKRWVTSSYYREQLPPWVADLNAQVEKRNLTGDWLPLGAAAGSVKPFCRFYNDPPEPSVPEGEPKPPAPVHDPRSCVNIESTPVGNELIEEFAEKAVVAENLGSHNDTDILTVSFSSNDYVGHAVGPDAPEVRDISIRVDRLIGKMMDFIDARVGAGNVIYVMTADHGVAPTPEVNQKRNMPGGRMVNKTLTDKANAALSARFGEGNWFTSGTEFLNLELISSRHLNRSEVEKVAADAMETVPHVARVYTRTELQSGSVTGDPIGRGFTYAFFPPRSGDLFVLLEPYWMFAATGSTHGTPYWYDAHVPVLFMGPGIKPGTYNQKIAVNDIAPTLTEILGVDTPSGSSGRILTEILGGAPAVPATAAAKSGGKSK